jgi:hypothetical protein
MKIPYAALLAAGLALGQSLLTDGQSLSPAARTLPAVNQSLILLKHPPGSIWQPLPDPLGSQQALAPQQKMGILSQGRTTGPDLKPRPIFPSELPSLNYSDLRRDSQGHLHPPALPPGYTSVDKMPCLVPDLALVEHMPIRRMHNADPINRMPARAWRTPDVTKK